MFVVSERNIVIPGPNGKKFHMPRKFMGKVPEWVEKSAYFKALVKDGKVIISASSKDKDVGNALNRGRKGSKKQPAKKQPAPPSFDTKPEDPPGDTTTPEDGSDEGNETL